MTTVDSDPKFWSAKYSVLDQENTRLAMRIAQLEKERDGALALAKERAEIINDWGMAACVTQLEAQLKAQEIHDGKRCGESASRLERICKLEQAHRVIEALSMRTSVDMAWRLDEIYKTARDVLGSSVETKVCAICGAPDGPTHGLNCEDTSNRSGKHE